MSKGRSIRLMLLLVPLGALTGQSVGLSAPQAAPVWASTAPRAADVDWVRDVLVSVFLRPNLAERTHVDGFGSGDGAAMLLVPEAGVDGSWGAMLRHTQMNASAGFLLPVKQHTLYRLSAWVYIPEGAPSFFGQWPTAFGLARNSATIAQGETVREQGKWCQATVEFDSGDHKQIRFLIHSQAREPWPAYYVDNYDIREKRGEEWSENLVPQGDLETPAEDLREKVLRELDPDLLDWHTGIHLDAGRYFSDRGVRVSGGAWEIEYDWIGVNDPQKEAFLEEGVVRDIQGRPVEYFEAYPGWHMCHNAPRWHEHQKAGLMRVVPYAHSVSQDNICNPPFFHLARGCFCRWCQEGFREHLAGRLTPAELSAAGIGELAGFDMPHYLKSSQKFKLGEPAMLEDPIVREWIRYQYVSQLGRWADIVRSIREKAIATQGADVAIYGNQWGAWGNRPYAVALSGMVDVVWIEGPVMGPSLPPLDARRKPRYTAWNALWYKLGAAQGSHRKPVWGIQYPAKTGPRWEIAARLVLAEAQANGGLIDLCWGMDKLSGEEYELHRQHIKFLHSHRGLLTRREAYAKVGLIYSLPSALWRKFSPLGLRHSPHLTDITTMARLLEEAHIPYEVVCLGHPEVFDDTEELARLSRYRLLIAPAVDCLSGAQVEALRTFLAAGGAILTTGEFATRDEDCVALDRPSIEAGRERVAALPDEAVAACGGWVPEQGVRPPEAAQLEELIRGHLGDAQLLTTTAPPMVWTNLWLDEAHQVLSVQLLNYDLEATANAVRAVEKLELAVILPEGFRCDRALLIPERGEPSALEVRIEDRSASVVVPRLELWAIVVFTAGPGLEALEARAQARTAINRLEVAARGTGQHLYWPKVVQALRATLAWTDEDYAGGRAEEALTVARELAALVRGLLEEAARRNERAERSHREALIARAETSVVALDFGPGPAAPGFTPVGAGTLYDRARGFGWEEMEGLADVLRAGPDDLHADFVEGRGGRTFIVDLPNGDYSVTVAVGDDHWGYHFGAPVTISAQGTVEVEGLERPARVFQHVSFGTQVTDGKLKVGFDGPKDWCVNALLLAKGN